MRNIFTTIACIFCINCNANAYTLEEELTCLTANIYHEARGAGFEEMTAVAHVTLNRVASPNYPNTICGVVMQPYQFTWTKKPPKVMEANAWKKSASIAINVYRGVYFYDETKGATHYWARRKIDRPYWAINSSQEIDLKEHTYVKL